MPRQCMIESGGVGDAASLAMAASRLNRKTRKHLKKKTSRASSEAGFSIRSGMSGFRVKSAFLVGRRGSPSTPMPTWKVHGATPIAINMEKHLHANGITLDSGHDRHHHQHDHLPRPYVSARKLAASLWELQELPFSRGGAAQTPHSGIRPYQTHIVPYMNNHFNSDNQQMRLLQMRLSVGRHEGEGGDSKIRFPRTTPRNLVPVIEAISSKLESRSEVTANELVKVLNYMWSLEERHVHTMSVVGALRAEVDQARSQLKDLLLKESAHSKKAEHATKRIAEERAMWQEEQEVSIREALFSIRQELDSEKKSKRKLEALHKKTTKELRDARKELGIVLEDFEKERRARELMEDVCDELAREVGEDKARVEELKRESLKVREEVEEERKMLQMAEVWREERVQMKLMEAKLELEEKNTALDKLRSELELFLKAKRESDTREKVTLSHHTYRHSLDASSGKSFGTISHTNEQRGLVPGRNSFDSVGNGLLKKNAGEGLEGEDDLHSIELTNKMFKVMPEMNQTRHHSSHMYGSVCNGRKSVDERSSTTHKNRHSASRRVQGLEPPRSNNQDDVSGREEMGAEQDGHDDHSRVSQWIECSFEGGEMKEWGLEQQKAVQTGREECIRSWKNGNGNGFSHEPLSCSLKLNGGTVDHKVERANSGPHSGDRKESVFSRDQPDFLCRKFDFQNVQSSPLLGNGHEGFNLASSPTREWSQLWTTPYLERESSRGVVDGSVIKLEGQQRACWRKPS